ncbi:rhodanese-like domain-containing protein [Flavobacteriaceae bacterium LMO-SS05]
MRFFEFIFGAKKKHEVEEFLTLNAIILDVRTQPEWDRGHIKKSIHIPLDQIKERLPEIKQLKKPIITVCESGVRSAKAAKFLNSNHIKATNGGGWKSLNNRIAHWAKNRPISS